jgi:hypothetical protein
VSYIDIYITNQETDQVIMVMSHIDNKNWLILNGWVEFDIDYFLVQWF